MICTGRSDFPNQVNNVLCFPYIFRGALDCRRHAINEEMKMAAVARSRRLRAKRRRMSRRRPMAVRRRLRPGFADPLPVRSAADPAHRAGGRQGCDGDRRRDAADRQLRGLCRSARPLRLPLRLHHEADLRRGQDAAGRVIYAEGEDERVLRAAQVLLEEKFASPILIGRPQVIETRLKRFGLTIRPASISS